MPCTRWAGARLVPVPVASPLLAAWTLPVLLVMTEVDPFVRDAMGQVREACEWRWLRQAALALRAGLHAALDVAEGWTLAAR
jgi:hypothetical protein